MSDQSPPANDTQDMATAEATPAKQERNKSDSILDPERSCDTSQDLIDLLGALDALRDST